MSIHTLACIKRVPDTGARINLTEDEQRVDDTGLGHTMSPHEECAIEEAVSQVETHGGSATVLTLGAADAEEQLRTGLAMQADDAILLETDEDEWDPMATAEGIAGSIDDDERDYDLLLFGNESADGANYQVGIRVAAALDLPCVTGSKGVTVEDGTVQVECEISRGAEIFEVEMPAVVTVKEGINEPRYPSMRAKMQARRQEIDQRDAIGERGGPKKLGLIVPEEDDAPTEVLGEGPGAAAAAVDVFEELEVL